MPETESGAEKTAAVAIYAAVVATLALGWQIYQYLDARPKLEIDVVAAGFIHRGDPKLAGPGQNRPLVVSPTIRFMNKGSKPVSIYLADADLKLHDMKPALLDISEFNSPYLREPFKLNENEVKEWKPVLVLKELGPPLPDSFEVKGIIRLSVGSTDGFFVREFDATFLYTRAIAEPILR